MTLPGNPPATTAPAAFKTWAQNVADTAADHETRVDDLETDVTALDGAVVHDTGNETVAGIKTFSSDPIVPAEAYGAGWNGSNEPPTKNDVYDKIESLTGLSAGSIGGPPLIVRKTSDESVTSSTTVQADDALLFAVGTSQVWAVQFLLFANGATAADIKIGVQGPASATGKFAVLGLAAAATTSSGDVISQGFDLSSASPPASTLGIGVGGTTDYGSIQIHGSIATGGTSGNCTLYWAQSSSSGTATKVLADSLLIAHRLS